MPRGPKGQKRPADVIGNATIHETLRASLASLAGIEKRLWSMEDVAKLLKCPLF